MCKPLCTEKVTEDKMAYQAVHCLGDVWVVVVQLQLEYLQCPLVVMLHFLVAAQVGAENGQVAELLGHVRVIRTQELVKDHQGICNCHIEN